MNMADLLRKRKEYEILDNNYGEIDPTKLIKELPNFKSKEEIMASAQTIAAKDYFEKISEQVVDYLGMRGYDYDLLKVCLNMTSFLNERAIRRVQEWECNIGNWRKHNLEPEDFLDDYVVISYDIIVGKADEGKMNELSNISDYTRKTIINSSENRFVVKYSELIELLNQIGYEVDLGKFESVRKKMCFRESSIEAIVYIGTDETIKKVTSQKTQQQTTSYQPSHSDGSRSYGIRSYSSGFSSGKMKR